MTGLGLPIDVRQNVGIPLPAITVPGERAVVRALCGRLDRAGNQVLADGTAGAGDDKATVSVEDEASPAFSLVGLLSSAVFFCTNDQNSSISTWERRRSLVSTCVRASACCAARLRQT